MQKPGKPSMITNRTKDHMHQPTTQSQEIFSPDTSPTIPLIKLPLSSSKSDQVRENDKPSQRTADEDESDESEPLEVNASESPSVTMSKSPKDLLFPSVDYFPSSVGSPAAADYAPSINVRIAGSDLIQDVFLSPIVERPPSPTSVPLEDAETRTEQLTFALRPPPHLSRARRQPGRMPFQQDTNEGKPKERDNNSSAVSPRFMALRKLSEAGVLPPLILDHDKSGSAGHFQTQLLQRIDEIVQVNLREILGKTSQRVDTPPSQQDEELESLRKRQIELENQVSNLRLQNIGLERQLMEMEVVKARNTELEAEVEKLQQSTKTKKKTEWAEAVESDNEEEIRAELEQSCIQAKCQALEQQHADLMQVTEGCEAELARLQEENTTLRQIERVNMIQIEHLQRALDKKSTRRRRTKQEEFVTDDGHLTFTTEIDGRLSQYTIKLPNTQTTN
ncbi:hypothetical protein DFQ28_009189 [Apophysomyces sp. BC1034]|nr:hypothetical protein DFQ29_007884 [Apophysomyces sp. BC1021]KAG0185533.1 hypothetical protein DFQ28_009189 [Apophysomyces sp. BC1034]